MGAWLWWGGGKLWSTNDGGGELVKILLDGGGTHPVPPPPKKNLCLSGCKPILVEAKWLWRFPDWIHNRQQHFDLMERR